MDRFRELTVFTAVANEGAFNMAARRLGISAPAVTRTITALEERLGIRLFNRTTRRVTLTEPGVRLLADAERILAELEAAESSASGEQSEPRGLLRVTAPVLFGQRYLAPILRGYLDAHPAVTADLVLLDRDTDLIEEGIDVALRIGELPDSALSALRVGAVRRVTVAAPSLLAAHGTPETPEDLSRLPLVVSTAGGGGPLWEFVADGERRRVRLSPRLTVNSMQAALDAALAGWGATRLLSYQAADALADGRLVEILGSFEDRLAPIHLLHHEGRQASARIRAFLDLAAAALRADRAVFEARQSAIRPE